MAGEVAVDAEGGSRTIPYRLHTPAEASEDEPLPLVVFLHGAGERGDDNRAQLTYLPDWWLKAPHLGARHPAFVLAVQCPRGQSWSGPRGRGHRTWNLPGIPVPPAMQAVETLIRRLASDPSVDRTRIYLTGLSMGGYGTWNLLARHADWFAAAVPICGGGDPGAADRIVESGVPIWNVHGDADEVVSVDRSREIVEAIRAAGGWIGHTELPGVRHDSWSWAYGRDGVTDWMFAQRRPTPADVPAPEPEP